MQNERKLVYGVYANASTKTFSVIGMIRTVKTQNDKESGKSPVRESEEIPMLGSSTVALYNLSLDDAKKVRKMISTRWNFLMLKGEKHKVKTDL